jgi:hypothetical protein
LLLARPFVVAGVAIGYLVAWMAIALIGLLVADRP